ncbi:MAG: hypothetical protein ACLQG3_15095 [Terracidiphilus sp.]
MTIRRQARKDNDADTVVISFRLPRTLADKLDEIASGDTRSRANFVARTLAQAISLEPAIDTIATIQKLLCADIEKNPDGIQAEYGRGQLHGARWMLSAFFGDRAARRANRMACKKTGLPMPHVLPLQPDGQRYGFDMEAEF